MYVVQLLPIARRLLDLAPQNYVAGNIGTWQSLALSADQSHFLSSYGEELSSALMYNFFFDLLLETNVIPQSVCIRLHNLAYPN